MNQTRPPSDARTAEQVREHYQVEKQLADRLRRASKSERRELYSSLYDELYRRIPHHPQLTRKQSTLEKSQAVDTQMVFLKRFLTPQCTFLEVGPGDCSLSYEVARYVNHVYAVDVSNEITRNTEVPANFQLILSDGSSIPVAGGSVDVVYSNQLMEHLHSDDALDQLRNIFLALVPGGRYICATPNRLTGPHDISQGFDEEATCFHLREYAAYELYPLFKYVGFSNIRVYLSWKGKHWRCPSTMFFQFERLLDKLPSDVRVRIIRNRFVQGILRFTILATK